MNIAGFYFDKDTGKLTIDKDPDAVLDYTLNWATWLGADTITGTPVWTVPPGLTEPFSQANTGTIATVWLGGGTVGTKYTLTNRISTVGLRTQDQSFVVNVVEK